MTDLAACFNPKGTEQAEEHRCRKFLGLKADLGQVETRPVQQYRTRRPYNWTEDLSSRSNRYKRIKGLSRR